MLKSLELRDVMIHQPVTVSPNITVFEAAQIIMENKITGVIVVDDEKNLVGILSELDCLRVTLAGAYNDDEFSTALVRDVMTEKVVVQSPNDDIVDVATSMLEHRQRRRPVVENGKVVGQVTCRQILRVITEASIKK
ncbi:MAG: CBS domain-containing protein [Pseudomonadales bacterium]|jgi:CBS domain-containing protein|nr:CBS domain-containing protein [Pseudomonadales bacterium]MDG1443817.1 CBS domain-containing protein [Pseudomonadales bacterium]